MKIQTKPAPKQLKMKNKVKTVNKKSNKFISKSKLEKLGGSSMKKSRKKLKERIVDDDVEMSEEEDDIFNNRTLKKDSSLMKNPKKKLKRSKTKIQEEDEDDSSLDGDDLFTKVDKDEDDEEDDLVGNDEEVNDGDNLNKHKLQLSKLKNTDPQFYQFLQENDKELLKFDESDDEDEDGDREDKYHSLPDKLEGPSDESDIDEDDEKTPKTSAGNVTLKMIKAWQERLETDKTTKTIQEVVEVFYAAIASVSTDIDQSSLSYSVKGSAVFNASLQLCMFHLQPALKKYLQLPASGKFDLGKCKKWAKVKNTVKTYLSHLDELLSGVTSENVLRLLLKHIHQLTPFVTYFKRTCNIMLKSLIKLWCSAEESVRVLSFLCILRIANNRRTLLEAIIKSMYMSFIINCKFVSPTTLPNINFMRQSLVEILLLDHNVTYQHSFLYIRQLAINLRNAVTICKKESYQAVYNWQFLHCLKLWSDVLKTSGEKSMLRSLVYPLVQIIIGTIKLIPTSQYFPLRFHCVRTLITLSEGTGVFIPVLPFLLEILNSYDFNKRHKKLSMRLVDLNCLYRCAKSQMQENGFKDAVMEEVNSLLLYYLSVESYRIGYPDLIVTTRQQIKQFLKTCKVTNYCKKMKSALEVIENNNKFIEVERNKVTMNLSDVQQVQAWETKMKLKTTPLVKYYDNWKKIHQQQLAKKLTKNDEIADYKLPVLEKRKRPESSADAGPAVLFPSDDEDEDGDQLKQLMPEPVVPDKKVKPVAKKPKLSKKSKQLDDTVDVQDEVGDLQLSDWSDS